MDLNLSLRERFSLQLQRTLSWVTFPFFASLLVVLMKYGARYRIPQMREIRRRYRELLKSSPGPVILCANHLTKIDSAILEWSLAPVWTYIRSFRLFPWSMPERARYAGNLVLRLLCYVGRCVPVDRGGDRDKVSRTMNKFVYLLRKGDTVSVFPEGQRSRTGRIDPENFSYGVGRLVKSVENCRVLCVYLRGRNQNGFSSIPRRGEEFYLDLRMIQPRTQYTGLRATRDLSAQIVQQLAQMEQAYFATRGQ
jgi:hypothetical protein